MQRHRAEARRPADNQDPNYVGLVGGDSRGGGPTNAQLKALNDTFYAKGAAVPMGRIIPPGVLKSTMTRAVDAISRASPITDEHQTAFKRAAEGVRLAGCALRELLPEPDMMACKPRKEARDTNEIRDPRFCVNAQHGFVESEWVELYDAMSKRAIGLGVADTLSGDGVVMSSAEVGRLANLLLDYHLQLHRAVQVRHDVHRGLPVADECCAAADPAARATCAQADAERAELERAAGISLKKHRDIDWRALQSALRGIFEVAADAFHNSRRGAGEALPASVKRRLASVPSAAPAQPPPGVASSMARQPGSLDRDKQAVNAAIPTLLAASSLRMCLTHAMLLHVAGRRLGGRDTLPAAWMVRKLDDITKRLLVTRTMPVGPIDFKLMPELECLVGLRLRWRGATDPAELKKITDEAVGGQSSWFKAATEFASQFGFIGDQVLVWYLCGPLNGSSGVLSSILHIAVGGLVSTLSAAAGPYLAGLSFIGPHIINVLLQPLLQWARRQMQRWLGGKGFLGRSLAYLMSKTWTEHAFALVGKLWGLITWAFGGQPKPAAEGDDRLVRDLEVSFLKGSQA